MNRVSHDAADIPAASRPFKVSALHVFLRETRMECLRLMRSPSFSVPTILFPALFYLLFGIVLGRSHVDPADGKYVLALFIVFGSLAPGLFGLGVTLALERDRGLLQLKRALPMPAGVYLGAKVAMAMVFAGLVSVLLLVLGFTVARVMLDVVQLVKLFGISVFGVLPFCGMGLLLGTLVKGSAAPAVLNLVYLPMSFLSGVLVPLQALPHVFSQLAPIWPSYHLSQLALSAVGAPETSNIPVHMLVPAGLAVAFFAIARRRLQNVR